MLLLLGWSANWRSSAGRRAATRAIYRVGSSRHGRRSARAGVLALVGCALLVGCAGPGKQFNPGPPPAVGGIAEASGPQRAPRPAPQPEQILAVAENDVVAAGESFVRALFAADDAAAGIYQPGFGPKLREQEDAYELLSVSARPMSWGEAGYADAPPEIEWTEVVASVQGRRNSSTGFAYYRIGFQRADGLTIERYSRRVDVRD